MFNIFLVFFLLLGCGFGYAGKSQQDAGDQSETQHLLKGSKKLDIDYEVKVLEGTNKVKKMIDVDDSAAVLSEDVKIAFAKLASNKIQAERLITFYDKYGELFALVSCLPSEELKWFCLLCADLSRYDPDVGVRSRFMSLVKVIDDDYRSSYGAMKGFIDRVGHVHPDALKLGVAFLSSTFEQLLQFFFSQIATETTIVENRFEFCNHLRINLEWFLREAVNFKDVVIDPIDEYAVVFAIFLTGFSVLGSPLIEKGLSYSLPIIAEKMSKCFCCLTRMLKKKKTRGTYGSCLCASFYETLDELDDGRFECLQKSLDMTFDFSQIQALDGSGFSSSVKGRDVFSMLNSSLRHSEIFIGLMAMTDENLEAVTGELKKGRFGVDAISAAIGKEQLKGGRVDAFSFEAKKLMWFSGVRKLSKSYRILFTGEAIYKFWIPFVMIVCITEAGLDLVKHIQAPAVIEVSNLNDSRCAEFNRGFPYCGNFVHLFNDSVEVQGKVESMDTHVVVRPFLIILQMLCFLFNRTFLGWYLDDQWMDEVHDQLEKEEPTIRMKFVDSLGDAARTAIESTEEDLPSDSEGEKDDGEGEKDDEGHSEDGINNEPSVSVLPGDSGSTVINVEGF